MNDGGLCIWWPLDAADSMGMGLVMGVLLSWLCGSLWGMYLDWREARSGPGEVS